MAKNKFVIAVGGSIVSPNGIDANFLKKFVFYLTKQVKKGNQFILVVGGDLKYD